MQKRKRTGEAILINKKHTEGSGHSHSETGCQHEVADGPCSICERDNVDDICNGRCIHTGEGDSLKKPHDKKGPKRAKYNIGKEGEGRSIAPTIMMLFSEYLSRAPPTKSLEAKCCNSNNPDEHTYLSLVGT